MSQLNEKTAAPVSSVRADEGQSPVKQCSQIIADEPAEINDFLGIKEESPEERQKREYEEWERSQEEMTNPLFMRAFSMSELYNTTYESRPPLIDGLIYPGTYLFVGAPKVGKSFFMAQLAYHISTGLPLWNYSVNKSSVLYLALEDEYKRIQERLFRMYETDITDNLYFTNSVYQLGKGLEEQLDGFMKKYPDTNGYSAYKIPPVR